ncbi:MAG: glycoside hydrolase family 57 protein [Bacteroidota bacterium]|nr:glycoside hydrolase family 57 protein [Bacteroidota bacterium]
MSTLENTRQRQYITLHFQVHQPRRLKAFNLLDTQNEPLYFDDVLNEDIVRRVAQNCYIPANNLLMNLIARYPQQVKIAFSLSGVVLEQLQAYAPEALESFQKLIRTGSVELLGETFYQSLASLRGGDEFEIQVLQHAEKMFELFGVRPTVFRNTGLIYNDEIGKRVAMLGFSGVLTEGHEKILAGKSPHKLYCHPEISHLKILLRNYHLSDDIAFRFTQGGSPLSVGQYMEWLNAMPGTEKLVNLAMGYETFGEHHKSSTGIFSFLDDLLQSLATSDRFSMVLPQQALQMFPANASLAVEDYLSWADIGRDISAWLGNDMQKDAFNSLMNLEGDAKITGIEKLLRNWRYLQTSDHFYYMSGKTDSDGSVHSWLSPFTSAYDAFINFMNIVTHVNFTIQREKGKPAVAAQDLSSCEAERQGVKANTPVWVQNLESVPQENIPHSHG